MCIHACIVCASTFTSLHHKTSHLDKTSYICGKRTLTARVDVVSVLTVAAEVSAVLPVGLVGGVKLGR